MTTKRTGLITGTRPGRRSRGVQPDLPLRNGLDERGHKIAEAMEQLRTVITAAGHQHHFHALLTIGTEVRALIEERDRWKPDEQRLIDLAADQVTPLCESGDQLIGVVERLQEERDTLQAQVINGGQQKVDRFQQQAKVGEENNDRLRDLLHNANRKAKDRAFERNRAQRERDEAQAELDGWRKRHKDAMVRCDGIASGLQAIADKWRAWAHEHEGAMLRAQLQRDEARAVALRLADELEHLDQNLCGESAMYHLEGGIKFVKDGHKVPRLDWPKDGKGG